eukprot:s1547_g7.t1
MVGGFNDMPDSSARNLLNDAAAILASPRRVNRRVRFHSSVACASKMFCCCAAEPPNATEEKLREAATLIKTAPAMTDFIADVFEVRLKDGMHGIVIDVTDPECTIVKHIREGTVSDWNSTCPDGKSVNGVRGSSVELAKALGTDGPMVLSLQRPEERVVKLQRPGEIGVVLNYKKLGSKAPWITKISAGLLTRWNEDTPDQAVGIHDRVRAVNGATGAPEELGAGGWGMELMTGIKDAAETLELTAGGPLRTQGAAPGSRTWTQRKPGRRRHDIGRGTRTPRQRNGAPAGREGPPEVQAAPPQEDEKYAVYRRMHRTGVPLLAIRQKLLLDALQDPTLDVAVLDTFDGAAGTGAGAPAPAAAPAPAPKPKPKEVAIEEPAAPAPAAPPEEEPASAPAELPAPGGGGPINLAAAAAAMAQRRMSRVAAKAEGKSEPEPKAPTETTPAVPKGVGPPKAKPKATLKAEEPAAAPAAPAAPAGPIGLFAAAEEGTAPKAPVRTPPPPPKAKASTAMSPEAALRLRRSVVAQVQEDDAQSDVSDF